MIYEPDIDKATRFEYEVEDTTTRRSKTTKVSINQINYKIPAAIAVGAGVTGAVANIAPSFKIVESLLSHALGMKGETILDPVAKALCVGLVGIRTLQVTAYDTADMYHLMKTVKSLKHEDKTATNINRSIAVGAGMLGLAALVSGAIFTEDFLGNEIDSDALKYILSTFAGVSAGTTQFMGYIKLMKMVSDQIYSHDNAKQYKLIPKNVMKFLSKGIKNPNILLSLGIEGIKTTGTIMFVFDHSNNTFVRLTSIINAIPRFVLGSERTFNHINKTGEINNNVVPEDGSTGTMGKKFLNIALKGASYGIVMSLFAPGMGIVGYTANEEDHSKNSTIDFYQGDSEYGHSGQVYLIFFILLLSQISIGQAMTTITGIIDELYEDIKNRRTNNSAISHTINTAETVNENSMINSISVTINDEDNVIYAASENENEITTL